MKMFGANNILLDASRLFWERLLSACSAAESKFIPSSNPNSALRSTSVSNRGRTQSCLPGQFGLRSTPERAELLPAGSVNSGYVTLHYYLLYSNASLEPHQRNGRQTVVSWPSTGAGVEPSKGSDSDVISVLKNCKDYRGRRSPSLLPAPQVPSC